MTMTADENDNAVDEGKQEEMHCIRCGAYMGAYGPGSNATVPCPKCGDPNVMNYTGEEFIVKRRRRKKA